MNEQLIFSSEHFAFCHAPTVVDTPQGLLMACFAGPAEGHKNAGIWGATFSGEWCDQKQIVDSMQDNGQRVPLWNPVLFTDNSEIRLYYRIGTSPTDWQCAYVSTSDANTWSSSEPLSSALTGPVRNKPLKLESGNIIVPTSTEIDDWSIHFELLEEGTDSWKIINVPGNGIRAIQPVIVQHENNTLQALCRTRNSYIAQTWSVDGGLTWSQLELTDLINPNAAIDAITCDGLGYLLVYNDCQFGRYKLVIAASSDGHSWEVKVVLEESMGEYSYPSLAFSENGSLHILYTFNRKNIKHVEISDQEVLALFGQ